MATTATTRITNASGHEVKVDGNVLIYHATRMLAALELVADLNDEFAATLAIEHAVAAAHEARETV